MFLRDDGDGDGLTHGVQLGTYWPRREGYEYQGQIHKGKLSPSLLVLFEGGVPKGDAGVLMGAFVSWYEDITGEDAEVELVIPDHQACASCGQALAVRSNGYVVRHANRGDGECVNK